MSIPSNLPTTRSKNSTAIFFLNRDLSKRVKAIQALLIGCGALQKPQAIPSSWPLDGASGTELHPVHLGRFNTLEGAQVFRLDDWIAKEQPPKIDFVKMHVDGYEIGAAETFCHTPLIMMEFAPHVFPERGRSFKELLDALLALGYRARTVGGKALQMESSIEALIPRGGSINVVLEAQ